MILGPNGPFTNLPPSIEAQVEWISELIGTPKLGEVRNRGAVPGGRGGWTETCEEIANMTLFPKAESWIFGANIPGKKKTVMFYMAGIGNYRAALAESRSGDYLGLSGSARPGKRSPA